MSGIAGFVRLDGGAADPSSVRRMVGRMAHRGPDGSRVWCGPSAALGHLMLHTTPESLHETLPRASRGGLHVITADARIDNRDELIEALRLAPDHQGVITDSDVILAAYDRWGEECPERLLGDFAFAIWNVETKRLFCARDHIGVKPFYYTLQQGRLLAFASEIKGLLALPEVPERLNELRLADYLANEGRHDKEITAFDGVLRLPPATAMVVSASGLEARRYWEPVVGRSQQRLTDAEYAHRFAEIFTEAVRCRVRSAYPVATELSGGLDSSYVTCVARDVMRGGDQPLHAISLVFEQSPECDERPFIDAVAQGEGVISHQVAADDVGPLSDLQNIFEYLDDGATGGNHHLIWRCCQIAQGAGARVLLDGIDGDTVVAHGLERFGELARAGDWDRFAEEMEAARALMADTPDRHEFHDVLGSPRELLNRFAFPVVLERANRGEVLSTLVTLGRMRRHLPVRFSTLLKICARRIIAAKRGRPPETENAVTIPRHLREEFVRRTDLRPRLEAGAHLRRKSRSVREKQKEMLDSNGFPHLMELTDHYAAAHALDIRHPFLDKRLVEFCLSLPSDQSLRRGWTRVVMRNAMTGVVPELVRARRGKTNLAAAFDRGLFEVDSARLNAALAPGCPLDDYVERESLEEALARGAKQAGIEIWQLCHHAVLSTWLRKRRFDLPAGSANHKKNAGTGRPADGSVSVAAPAAGPRPGFAGRVAHT